MPINFKKKMCIFLLILFFQSGTDAIESKFILLVPEYNEWRSRAKANEYITCLQNNFSNVCIKKIHVMYEMVQDWWPNPENTKKYVKEYLKSTNAEIFYLAGGQFTFQMLVNYANHYYPNQLIIIANPDVYFDDTLSKLKSFNFDNTIVCLTPWKEQKNGSFKLANSNVVSAWVFKTPINLSGAELILKTRGIEGILGHVFNENEIEVVNLSKEVKIHQLCKSGIMRTPAFNYFDLPQKIAPFSTINNASGVK